MLGHLCSVVVLLAAVLPAQDDGFRFASIFGDHMVLPAARSVPLHGRGPAGADVVVTPSWTDAVECRVGPDGRFRVEVETPAKGASGRLVARCGDAELALDDVLFGDVWLASGQSNMEMLLGAVERWKGVRDWEQEVAAADHPTLRVFTVGRRTVDAGTVEGGDVSGEWQVCSPETAARFSAVGYFFARDLVVAGDGPIGLVVSSWGGTKCEAWTSAAGLADFPEFAAALKTQRTGAKAAMRDVQRAAFFEAVERATPNANADEVTLPELWSAGGLGDFDGAVDYERELALPADFVGQDLVLELGAIDDMDQVFWNGARVAGTDQPGFWNRPRRYGVPAARVDGRYVKLRLTVVDTGGEGGVTGPAEGMRLSLASDPARRVALAGRWQRRLRCRLDVLPKLPRVLNGPNRPSVLYNGMIAPLLPFPFRGVVWYQGESNRGDAEQYARLFPAMIRDWRRALGAEVPFFFVQIAPFGYAKDGGGDSAALRAAQAAALALPATGMVVTLDCGDRRDIHPQHKQPVGARLARLARADVYGDRDVVARAPVAVAARRVDGAVQVVLDGGAVRLDPDAGPFELRAEDGRWRRATASLVGGELRLVAEGVAQPVAARYAWRSAPTCALRGPDDLPVAPFSLVVQ